MKSFTEYLTEAAKALASVEGKDLSSYFSASQVAVIEKFLKKQGISSIDDMSFEEYPVGKLPGRIAHETVVFLKDPLTSNLIIVNTFKGKRGMSDPHIIYSESENGMQTRKAHEDYMHSGRGNMGFSYEQEPRRVFWGSKGKIIGLSAETMKQYGITCGKLHNKYF